MLSLRIMTDGDISLGMRLREQAGWNQTEADWQRCLKLQPDGCFVAEYEGVSAGTVTTCIFGSVAWIAMVLVDITLRGRGIGRRLLEAALTFLDARGIASVRLDATPLGRPLYQSLGFVEEYALIRHEGVLSADAAAAACSDKIAVGAISAAHLERVLQLDRQITSTDRQALLRRLFVETPEEWRLVGRGEDVLGYAATRAGSRARQIGPIMAMVAEAGLLLLSDAWRRHAGQRVFVDVPVDNRAALAAVQAAGLVPQRPLYRMGRGPRVPERIEHLWASFGPEKG
ncbi:MAG TPA: GNAT family N-acetyltransferase [Gemmataceae bacterium]|nr:GNAT family N-acetyltransferase [Gemmataceae bacterium]